MLYFPAPDSSRRPLQSNSADEVIALRLYLNLGHTVDHLLMLIFPTVVLAMSAEFGRPYGELLPLALGGFIAFGACSIPAGWLADHWSRFGMMVVFFFGIGFSSIATGLARTPAEIALGLTAVGVFAAIYHPVGTAMLVANTEQPGRLLGINGVFGNLGLAFSALLAGALADTVGWRWAFILPGALTVALGAGFLASGEPAPAGAGAATTAPARPPNAALARIFGVLTVATICNSIIFNATTISMPKVFDERLTALTQTTFGIGALVCAVYVIAAMSQLLIGRLIDRRSMKQVFVAVVALQVPLLAFAVRVDNVLMLAVALGMMFCVFGQTPINDAMIARYTAERWRARAYAVRYVMSFSASALAVPLVAFAHRTSGDFAPLFMVLTALAAVALIAALAFPGRPAGQAS